MQKPLSRITALSVSTTKGCSKQNVTQVEVIEGYGIKADAHAGDWHRQVSLLAQESIDKVNAQGLELKPGQLAENITTQGIALSQLTIGAKLSLGDEVLLEVTQLGKECHQPCAIYYQLGYCIMPKEGIFARVISGGTLRVGDQIVVR
jgi:MOSC domain-containing protein YiiM